MSTTPASPHNVDDMAVEERERVDEPVPVGDQVGLFVVVDGVAPDRVVGVAEPRPALRHPLRARRELDLHHPQPQCEPREADHPDHTNRRHLKTGLPRSSAALIAIG